MIIPVLAAKKAKEAKEAETPVRNNPVESSIDMRGTNSKCDSSGRTSNVVYRTEGIRN